MKHGEVRGKCRLLKPGKSTLTECECGAVFTGSGLRIEAGTDAGALERHLGSVF